MMKKLIYLIAPLVLLACGGEQKEESETSMTRDERLKFIRGVEEKSFGENANFDKGSALLLTKQYAMFADENPDDELTPNFLFKAGDIAMGLEKGELAISHFNRLIDDSPEFERIPYCFFLRAFIYENQIGDLEKAESAYNEFIDKFPDHEMTESARFSLKNLGKSPEELIREFEGNQDTTQVES